MLQKINKKLSQSSVTSDEKKQVDYIAGYPRVTPETFDNSYFLNDIQGETPKTELILEDTLSIKKTGEKPLPGNPIANAPLVPVYEISFETSTGQQITLQDRYAFIGYGSNTSPEVLGKKFGEESFGQDKDVTIPVIMTNIKDHAVVHSAFFGGAGSIPVTMMRSEGDKVRVSTSFYTEDQVKRMNSSEPNYDVVRIDQVDITLNNGSVLPANPSVYDSIWGGLKSFDGKLMTNNCVPHETQLGVTTTMGAMRHAFNVCGGFDTLQKPFEHWVLDTKNPKAVDFPTEDVLKAERAARLTLRMDVNDALMDYAAPRNLIGTVIQPATLTNKRNKLLAKKNPANVKTTTLRP